MQFSAAFLSLLALATAIPVANPIANEVPTTKAEADALVKSVIDQLQSGESPSHAMKTVEKAFNYDKAKAQAFMHSLQEQSQNMKRDAVNLFKREKWWDYFFCYLCGDSDYGCPSSVCAPP